METLLVRSDSGGNLINEERVVEAWGKVCEQILPLNASVWISEFRDHKGTLMVIWEVKPTKSMMGIVDMVWELDFNESSTEHYFRGKEIQRP